jgi:hypothetical protein
MVDNADAVALVMAHLSLADSVRAGQVCKLWREVSLRPIPALKVVCASNKSFDLSPFLGLRDSQVALRLLKARGGFASHVNLGYIRVSSMSEFVPLLSTTLRSFDVSSITSKKAVTDETLESLTARCPMLTRINLFGCWLITDASLKFISKCQNVWKKEENCWFFLKVCF